MNEKKEGVEKKKKKRLMKLLILLAVLLFFLPFLVLGYSIAKNKLISFLSNPIILESVVINPHGFDTDFPYKFSWKSIEVKMDGVDLFFDNPKIFIDPMLDFGRELLNISIDSVHAKIKPSSDTTENEKSLEFISHPDLYLPFRISVNVHKAAIDVEEAGNWNLDSLRIAKSGRQKRFYIRANNIRGTHLAKNLFLNAEYRWNEIFSDASVSVSDKTRDSLVIILNAPREHLEDLSIELNANVDNLPFWLKDKWSKDAPVIEKIVLNSNASVNILSSKIDFDLSLKTKIGEFWQLPKFNAAINASGNNFGISRSEIFLNGNNGESIRFKGNVSKSLDGSGELEINGINITLGPETLPTDVKFHRIIKKGNYISTNFTTGAGSNFTAKMADLDNPVIVFSADLAPEEPWAVQWTGDMVKLENPTILTGSFSFKDVLLKANLKTKVPFAYYAAADELDVSLWLNSEGIHFPKGTIKRNGYMSDFTGEVMWDKEYFTFKLNQQSLGTAEVYGIFSPKIDLNLQNINTRELPFADTNMLKGYNGTVTGNWNHNFEKRIGEASVSLSTVIKDYVINANSNVKVFGDSLIVRKFELKQKEKKVEGSLFALLPSETRKNFEIQQASIKVPNMDLVSILAVFKDSTLLSGYLDGGLKYKKETGLEGLLQFSKITLRNLDSDIANFPELRLEAHGRSAKISTHLFLGEGLWNGNLEAGIERIGQNNDLPIFVSFKANNIDNVGNFKFEGFLSKDMKKISGNANVLGDWFLPNGVGEIKNANINISAKSVLGKNILDSLTATFGSKHNTYEIGIIKIPFVLNGRVRNSMLLVDSAFVYGQNDEKVTAKLQFDLNSLVLKDFSFNTEQFTLSLLDEHWIKIRNGTGRTKLDSLGLTIFAELPSVSYRMESTDYGTAVANINGNATYRFPFQIGQSQTNSSITGNFEISKAFYKKTLDLMPDPLHLDRTIKSMNKFLESLVRERRLSASEKYAMTSRPTTLNIRVRTSGMETATVSSNIAEFAFVANVYVLGTTRNILLSGDLNAVGDGKIGYNGLTMFDLSSFRLYWLDAPIKQGVIDLRASNDYPLCFSDRGSNEEICTIFVNVTGPLAQLNMQPTTSCNNIDASPALIYYSMLLGCISEDYDANIDRNKVTGKFLGKALSSTINRGIGRNVFGDIDLKMQIFNDIPQEQDTSYIRVPINLSNLVSNLEAIFGYTSDKSLNPRYDQSVEAGLRYKLPVFDSTDINRNFIDPSLDISANLIARRYLSTMESDIDETRLEKNVGLVYSHKFWDPCILGIGYCKIADNLSNSSK